jgi:hypothetical protein
LAAPVPAAAVVAAAVPSTEGVVVYTGFSRAAGIDGRDFGKGDAGPG